MKKIAIQFSIIYTLVSILSVLISLIIVRRTDFDMLRPGPIFIGSVLISALVLLSLRLFQGQWGNGIGNVILSYLLLIPIPFIVRFMFVGFVFRVIGIIYLVLGIMMLVYLGMVMYVRIKNQHTEVQLNALLKKRKQEKTK